MREFSAAIVEYVERLEQYFDVEMAKKKSYSSLSSRPIHLPSCKESDCPHEAK